MDIFLLSQSVLAPVSNQKTPASVRQPPPTSGQTLSRLAWLSRTMALGGARTINKSVLLAIGILAGAVYVFADSDAPVPFPSGYRKWAVTRSLVAGPESRNAGFHHYYANPNAVEGFATGKFPEGSVIVDERLEVEK